MAERDSIPPFPQVDPALKDELIHRLMGAGNRAGNIRELAVMLLEADLEARGALAMTIADLATLVAADSDACMQLLGNPGTGADQRSRDQVFAITRRSETAQPLQ